MLRTAKYEEHVSSYTHNPKALACEAEGGLVNAQGRGDCSQPSAQHAIDVTPGRCLAVSRRKFKYQEHRCKHSTRIWAADPQKQGGVIPSLPTNPLCSALH